MCVLDIDSGELNMPEDVPSLPDRAEFGVEVKSVLKRWSIKLCHSFFQIC